jgi:3-keto-disaccharide hydrolase
MPKADRSAFSGWSTSGSLARRLAVAIVPIALSCTSLAADDPPKGSSRTPGPVVLFDGKTLDGWKNTPLSKPGEVKVKDGAILMEEGNPMTGITSTRKDLPTSNYELRYEAMRVSGGDFFAAATFPVGKSFITLVNGGWGGSVTGLSSLNGADASENETSTSFKYKEKTWYKFTVRVTDTVIRCRIDDKEIVAVSYEGVPVSTRIESRGSQPLGFAAWRTTSAIRAIEVRPLTPDEIATTNKLDR